MSTRTPSLSTLLVICMLALMFAGPTLAQDRPGRGGGEGGDRPTREQFEQMTDEEREAFREQMRQRMEERRAERDNQVREQMDMSVEEWELIGPKIAAIRQMQMERQMADGGGRGFAGRGGQQGGRGGEGQQGRGGPELSEEGTALQSASGELRELLADEGASSGEIKEALKALRAARTAFDTKIKDAQEDLRGLLTTKQEAMLVAQGVLS